MASSIVRLLPPPPGEHTVNPKRWIGRLVDFELITGTRVSARIIAISENWIDTDNGAMRVEHIVRARWISEEEAQITRGGPLNSYNPNQFRR